MRNSVYLSNLSLTCVHSFPLPLYLSPIYLPAYNLQVFLFCEPNSNILVGVILTKTDWSIILVDIDYYSKPRLTSELTLKHLQPHNLLVRGYNILRGPSENLIAPKLTTRRRGPAVSYKIAAGDGVRRLTLKTKMWSNHTRWL